jgi:predicted site-specific integrase-resolvase
MTGPSPAATPNQLLTGPEVCQLLNIGKSTLQPWREDGALVALELPKGGWRYPSNQPLIQRALELLGGHKP